MDRKQFITLTGFSLLAHTCRHKPEEIVLPLRQLLLEADLRNEMTTPGSFKTNTTVGVLVRRIASGNAVQAFECLWMICTHAKCTVLYNDRDEQFVCPCHGSVFDKHGQVLQGPAAAALERKSFEIEGHYLKVYA